MKKLILLTVLSAFLFVSSKAEDEFVTGLLITNKNDTLLCKILIPKDFGKFNETVLFSKVTILDSTGNKKKYTPKDISGYAFVYNNKKYIFHSIQIEDDGKRMFVWPLNMGKRINEYYYYTYNSSDLQKGSLGALGEIYVLENAETTETVSITRGGSWTNNYRTQIRRFFENDKKILKAMAQDLKEFHDIDKFVIDANKD